MAAVNVALTRLHLFLLFVIYLAFCDGQTTIFVTPVCSYFGGGRTPKEAYSLSNCTWYKENACCERTEVTSVFSEMPALLTDNQGCYNRMNYLMCYFCSPNQHFWFNNNTMSVCRSYCDAIYKYCSSAKYNGVSIGSKYRDGLEFCKAQMFDVVDEENLHGIKNCFQFNAKYFDAGVKTGASRLFVYLTILSGLSIGYLLSGG